LNHYIQFETISLQSGKHLSPAQQKKNDATQLSKKNLPGEEVILLDEKGKEMTSVEFSALLKEKMNAGLKSLCFVIGGAYGFDESVYEGKSMLSLSKMTLPHQLAKIFYIEQLYRAFTIIKNEKYHHG